MAGRISAFTRIQKNIDRTASIWRFEKTFLIIIITAGHIILLQTLKNENKFKYFVINSNKKEHKLMKTDNLTAQGRETLERFKMEAANEVGVNLKNGYNGDITAREAGSVGGMMVKKMIDSYKQGLKG